MLHISVSAEQKSTSAKAFYLSQIDRALLNLHRCTYWHFSTIPLRLSTPGCSSPHRLHLAVNHLQLGHSLKECSSESPYNLRISESRVLACLLKEYCRSSSSNFDMIRHKDTTQQQRIYKTKSSIQARKTKDRVRCRQASRHALKLAVSTNGKISADTGQRVKSTK